MNASTTVLALSALAHDARLAVFKLLVQAGPEGLAAAVADALPLSHSGTAIIEAFLDGVEVSCNVMLSGGVTRARVLSERLVGFSAERTLPKWRRDVVKFSPVIKINSKGENTLGHTAPFPEEIPEMAINFFSYPNEIVLDPFGGSFTTPIVANRLDRIGVGIEINKERFRDSILRNISNKLGVFQHLIPEYDAK